MLIRRQKNQIGIRHFRIPHLQIRLKPLVTAF